MTGYPHRHYAGLQAVSTTALLLWITLVTAGLSVGTALALLSNQKAVGGNSFTTKNLIAPSSLSANAVGHDVQLSWGAGQNGNGYAVLGVGNGTNSNCSGASFANLASTAGTSYTDSGRYTPQGTWYCYQVQTTYGTWNSTTGNPVAGVQIGFVATSVQMINDGNHTSCSGSGSQRYGQAGVLDCGDQVVITFNQAVSTASGPTGSNTVCARQSNNTIWLGSTTTSGACNASETVNLGKLTGGTIGACDCRFNATYAWSNGNKTLTVTISARVSGTTYPTVSTAVWTFTPTTTSSKLQSATGAFHICDTNSGGGNCLPSTGSVSALSPLRTAPTLTPTATRVHGKTRKIPSPTKGVEKSPTPTPTDSVTPRRTPVRKRRTSAPTCIAPIAVPDTTPRNHRIEPIATSTTISTPLDCSSSLQP